MAFLTEDDGGKIKPSNYRQSYIKEEIEEIRKCASDPIYFIEKYVKIQHPKLGSIPFKLFEFQKNLLNVYTNSQRTVSMLSRQCGKTTTASAFILWWAIFKSDQTILVASKDQEGANEIMERLWYAYEELPWFLKPGVKKNDVKTKHFDNGSKIRSTATTKTSGRGKSNSLVYLDEFAFVRPNVAKEFWTSIYPTISTGGKIIITSTPNTDEDKFAQIWFNAIPHEHSFEWKDKFSEQYIKDFKENEPVETVFANNNVKEQYKTRMVLIKSLSDSDDDIRFNSFYAPWTHVPTKIDKNNNILEFRGEQFKRETISSGISEEEWLREFECSFITGDSTLVTGQKLAALKFSVRNPLYVDEDNCRWYEPIKANTNYGVVLDPSEGLGLDDACIQVWEIPSLKQVAEWNSNKVDQSSQTKILRRVLTRISRIQENLPEHDGFSNIYFSVERNGQGVGIIRAIEYEDENTFPGTLIDATETSLSAKAEGIMAPRLYRWRGLITTGANKKRYCLELKSLLERNLFLPRSEFLASQLKTFIKNGNSFRAKEGSKDDIVMSCVLMCMLIDEIRTLEPELDDYVRPSLEDDSEEYPYFSNTY